MTSVFRNKITGFVLFLLLGCNHAFSQNPRSYFYENELELSLPVKTHWSMDIGAGYRAMLQERLEGEKISGTGHEHLELNHFTNYKRDSFVLSLGFRYRFKELFDSSETDEFRIMKQIKFGLVNSSLPLSHRIRLEQRFIEHVIHRVRYELGFSQAISETFSLEAATEAYMVFLLTLNPKLNKGLL